MGHPRLIGRWSPDCPAARRGGQGHAGHGLSTRLASPRREARLGRGGRQPMREGRVRANGIEFAYVEEGEGPPVILLHGFPDTARSWSHQMRPLADAGFRAVAPWLRGYPPTEIPRDGYFDRGTLAADARELLRAFGGGEPVDLVGQDFGASIAYHVLAAWPELVRRAVVMAVPHPVAGRRGHLSAKHVHRSFHWWFFQLPGLPERALAADDFAFVDYLWAYWCAPGHRDD